MTMRAYQIIVFVLGALVCLAVGIAMYFYFQAADPDAQQARAAETHVEDVLAAVGRHIILPEGEEPTVATVSSLEPLEGQPFFANAKIGYKVLIYTTAKKAILYDPEADKLVEVAPLAVDAAQ